MRAFVQARRPERLDLIALRLETAPIAVRGLYINADDLRGAPGGRWDLRTSVVAGPVLTPRIKRFIRLCRCTLEKFRAVFKLLFAPQRSTVFFQRTG